MIVQRSGGPRDSEPFTVIAPAPRAGVFFLQLTLASAPVTTTASLRCLEARNLSSKSLLGPTPNSPDFSHFRTVRTSQQLPIVRSMSMTHQCRHPTRSRRVAWLRRQRTAYPQSLPSPTRPPPRSPHQRTSSWSIVGRAMQKATLTASIVRWVNSKHVALLSPDRRIRVLLLPQVSGWQAT